MAECQRRPGFLKLKHCEWPGLDCLDVKEQISNARKGVDAQVGSMFTPPGIYKAMVSSS